MPAGVRRMIIKQANSNALMHQVCILLAADVGLSIREKVFELGHQLCCIFVTVKVTTQSFINLC